MVSLGHFEGPLDPEESCSMFGEDMTPLRSREFWGMSHYPGPSCTHASVELRGTGGSNVWPSVSGSNGDLWKPSTIGNLAEYGRARSSATAARTTQGSCTLSDRRVEVIGTYNRDIG